jgi:hypothetical protein
MTKDEKRRLREFWNNRFQVVEVLCDQLIGVSTRLRTETLRQLWSEATLRKNCRCCRCFDDLTKGMKAFRPLGNAPPNRPDRMCTGCMTTIRERVA